LLETLQKILLSGCGYRFASIDYPRGITWQTGAVEYGVFSNLNPLAFLFACICGVGVVRYGIIVKKPIAESSSRAYNGIGFHKSTTFRQ
jgi:hypothetical protein